MKLFDSKGEYTPEEIKATLAGKHGTREINYVYHRLDKNNNFIEEMDYIQSFTIENSVHSDIKRSAKIEILDTGNINYLQDRIKPYARLMMPKEPGYSDVIKSLSPAAWWRMDEPVRTPITVLPPVDVANGNDYLTRETAYAASPTPDTEATYTANVDSDDATIRDEVWFAITIDSSQPLSLFASPISMEDEFATMTAEIYYAPVAEAELELLISASGIGNGNDMPFADPVPRRGIYYIHFVPESAALYTPRVSVRRPFLVEDSSGNGFTGLYANDTVTGAAPIVGTTGFSITGPTINWATEAEAGANFRGPLTSNVWVTAESSAAHDISFNYYYTDIGLSLEIQPNLDGDWLARLSVYGQTAMYMAEVVSIPQELVFGKHMFSFVLNPSNSLASVYIDGNAVATFPAVDDAGTALVDFADLENQPLFHTDHTVHNYFDDPSVKVDEATLYNKVVLVGDLRDVYKAGIEEVNVRSGYVEWPLGVFVLSSPSRTMVDGNTVIRQVDAYDQLINLKEDMFDYRYSVPAGTKYTQAIKDVLQTTVIPQSVGFTESIWGISSNSTILSDSSAELGNTTMSQSMATEWEALAISNLSMSTKIVGLTSYSEFSIYSDDHYIAWIHDDSGQTDKLIAHYNNELWSVNYSSITHAHLRIREAGSYIYFDTSSDGTTWVNRAKAVHRIPASTGVQVYIGVGPQTIKTRVSNFKLLAGRSPKVSLVNSDKILPTSMEWEPGKTKLSIINDLLGAINYDSAYYDEDGELIGKPYVSPSLRTAEFTYATDEQSVITGNVNQTVDLFAVPNKWVVIVSEPDRPVLVGKYTNADPLSPTSTVSRGRTIVDWRTEQNAPDQVTLDAQAARLAFEASQVYEIIEFTTANMPIHENGDVYDLEIEGLAIRHKYSEQSWSMKLENGATMTHRVRRVVNI